MAQRLVGTRLRHSGVIALMLMAPLAAADPCHPESGQSPCVASQQLWLPLAPSRYTLIPSATALKPGSVAQVNFVGYQHSPLVLVAPSPAPEGRKLPLVEQVIDASFAVTAGLTNGWEAGGRLSFVPWQAGTGIQAATSSAGKPLPKTALRDPVVGLARSGPDKSLGSGRLSTKARAELTLPLGDSNDFATHDGVSALFGATFAVAGSSLELSGDLAIILRRQVQLGQTTIGNELSAAVGGKWELLDDRLLALTLETWIAPGLVAQDAALEGVTPRRLPAEWSLGVASRPVSSLELRLAGGSGIPLSTIPEDHGDAGVEKVFGYALGTPLLRAGFWLAIVQ